MEQSLEGEQQPHDAAAREGDRDDSPESQKSQHMYILGLATMGESAAALLKDGMLVAAVEEERFTRVKHEGCFPIRSIGYCLTREGISLSEIDHVAVYWQPFKIGIRARAVLKAALRCPSAFLRKMANVVQELTPAGGGQSTTSQGSWLELFFVRYLLEKHFGHCKARVHHLDHHRCHMASAFFASPFEEATILIFDGGGEEVSTTLAVGTGTDISVLTAIPWPHSLGHFYSAMTGFLGFTMLDGEYKMMGLAPYNSPDYVKFIRNNILISDVPGSYRLNEDLLDYHAALQGEFNPLLTEAFGNPRSNDDAPFTEHHQKIASSVQAAFEEVVFDLALWAFENGGKHANVVIAGGCGLNCSATGRLLREGPFGRMYIPPAPHDAGCAAGAALLVYHEILGRPRKFEMTHAFYGPEYNDKDIAIALRTHNIDARALADEEELHRRAVDTLVSGQVIGWFQGPMEFGPRALGSRSFLADPRNDSIRHTINEKIKQRELFRPFAPSVKEECASEYFDISQESPFMNLAVPVRAAKRHQIPAVTHIDGTARIQTVNRANNPRYWNLLDRFEKRTGIPILLNTSFNIQEPIVCTPDQALATFVRSRVDALVIGKYFIDRSMIRG